MARRVTAVGLLGALCAGGLLACTTPGHIGERRYREGDRQGALATWRQVSESSHEYEAVQRRIADVENEFEQLVVRYEKRAAYYERKGRLAEAALNYRLALEFRSDETALARLQQLVRDLAQRKANRTQAFDRAFARGDLAVARNHLVERETLDPFDAQLLSDQRRLREALQGDVDRLLKRGRDAFAKEAYSDADEAFVAVLTLDPENGTARGYRSLIRDLDNEKEPAPGDPVAVRKPLTEKQIRAEGFHQNALAAERDGRDYAAIRHDLRALKADPNHRKSQLHLAALRRRLRPEIAPLMESGRAYYQQEDLNNALDQWRRVLLIDPKNTETREYVSRAERLLENLEQLRAGTPAVSSR